MLDWTAYIPTIIFVAYWAAIIGVAFRVISRRRSQGVSLAWLAVLAWLPIFGVVLYILVGESWLTRKRARRIRALEQAAEARFQALEPFAAPEDPENRPLFAPLNRLARATSPIPALADNAIELHDDADAFFPVILEEIAKAQKTISLMFYIYAPGGRVDQVTEALINAAKRGVHVRLLADAVGSRPFFDGGHVHLLRRAGAEVRKALPVNPLRVWAARIDLRNHRKLVVIDGRTAFTGSMNMADPKVFKQPRGPGSGSRQVGGKKIGPWVDIMARVEGPAAHAMDLVFAMDWCVESPDETLAEERPDEPVRAGESAVQIISSGPGDDPDELRRVLLQSMYTAERELVISTPYFVPDDSMMTALTTAAKRGVRTVLIVPERVDSILVRHASRSYFDELLRAGVQVVQFRGGLLHSKTAVIDRRLVLLGSANMDRRSLWINFELSIFVHDEQIAEQMRYIQHRYIADSICLTEGGWDKRAFGSKLLDNAAQLLAPIL
ncbi:MAG: cardiolipin synthase [Phycisphaerales bacterium]|nr:cardiolipin synthase [Planctomycetota bacterium]MCH8508653.1 cardiolipin synthase [Phycisphaerales bacterium]